MKRAAGKVWNCGRLGILLLGVILAAQAAVFAAEEQPYVGSPERGYKTLLNTPIGAPVLSEKEYFNLWKYWPEPLQTQAEKASEAERQEMARSRYGFQLSPDRKGPIPQQFTVTKERMLTVNCLACHGGPVEGTVIPGAGNSLLAMETLNEDLLRLRTVHPQPAPELAVPLPPDLPPVHYYKALGVNNAFSEAVAFLSVRDLDINRTPDLQFPVSKEAMDLPARTPAWWLSHRKTRYYYDAFIAKSHRDIMQFAFEFSIDRKTILGWENDFKDIYAYIESLRPPAYPHAVDQTLAETGKNIYMQNCAGCHGTVGANGRYPEKVFPLAMIGTDTVRALNFPKAFKERLAAGWTGYFGETPVFPDTGGYVAPPMDGIWARAPYLHNGSVPTLWHLLTPESRPAIWTSTENGFDQKRVGAEITAHDAIPKGLPADERRRYFETSMNGLGNQGHNYPPEGLPEKEKTALIEYMKTL
ncbi:hypothetical protein BH09VER1_BH09VER1_47000 [soil metagenome]